MTTPAPDPLPAYAELRCLSNFSFLRGASHPDELVQRAQALGYRALALTDDGSLAGVVRAHVAAKAAGLPLIVGAQFRVQARAPGETPFTLVLLAQTLFGYGNLCAFITQLRRAAPKGHYQLTRDQVQGHALRDCLALLCPDRQPPAAPDTPGHANRHSSGAAQAWARSPGPAAEPTSPADTAQAIESIDPMGPSPATAPPDAAAPASPLGRQAVQAADALAELGHWALSQFMGRCWIGVDLPRRMDDALWLHRLREMGMRTALPLVAVGDVHLHVRSRKPLHDVLTAIRIGQPLTHCGHALQRSAELHLRSRLRLAQTFPPELLAETLVVASRCHFSLDEIRYQYPAEVVPTGTTALAYLEALTQKGAAERWPDGVPAQVQAQLTRELGLIGELGYEHYFLTVHDIVAHARSVHILCQGRGSAANSAVCYCLGITAVNPAQSELLFERFISKERNEPPDIDVDFEHERREEVIQYLYTKYGRDRCALTATVISYHERSAIRDVGKALGFDEATLDAIARQHRRLEGQGVQAELLRELGLDVDALAVQQLMQLVAQILGFPRHLSQHTGGFVLTQGPLSRLVPIENAAMRDRTVIQWDKDDLDAAGLLKVDVLALGMLTALRRTFDFVAQRRGVRPTLATLPPDDPATYDMICRADTVGVFQIESRAQMSMLPRLQPRNFYDLVIEVAIVRPGPIQGGMVHPYLRRRQGLEKVTYEKPVLQQALARTLGVPIFQEQVMQIAILAAGFSPGEADALRRAMAAWRRTGTLSKYQQKIIDGMTANGYTPEFAESIFRQIQGFSEYGFPESHAASFAQLVYASSWLKCHEPAAFLAALLNSQPMGFYTPSQLVQDARRHGVRVRPVDVLHSDWDCSLEDLRHPDGPAVRLGLCQVSGLSQASGQRIVQARLAAGPTAPTGHAGHGPGSASATAPLDAGVHGLATQATSSSSDAEAWRDGQAPEPLASPAGQSAEVCLAQPQQVFVGHPPADPPEPGGPPPHQAGRLHASDATTTDITHQASQADDLPTPSPWPDVEALARSAGLDRREVQLLAAADALRGLAGHRRQQMWAAAGWHAEPALLHEAPTHEPPLVLPQAPETEAVAWDLAATHLSLRTHPMALLRPRLARWRLRSSQDLHTAVDGDWVRTAGIVTVRQQPPTAKGTTFVSLEDEFGSLQVIVWRHVRDAQRPILQGARLMAVQGRWQREGLVCNLIAHRLADLSALLAPFATGSSRDFH
ncbi:error-prone DNA polymerase [Comamonas serinivorans]|uniref:error-prone DNA polymerase n=1 Tax=Comamonas serinivorans TaxID=1082851 RepID=UPI001F407D2C|nr:error-prone DNA polymerase [Comamonas serinivorans]